MSNLYQIGKKTPTSIPNSTIDFTEGREESNVTMSGVIIENRVFG